MRFLLLFALACGGPPPIDAGADGGMDAGRDAGIPCRGCFDGPTCLPGETLLACGNDGMPCEACDDGDPCTEDRCETLRCTHTPIDGC
jgi:hypothetical protein